MSDELWTPSGPHAVPRRMSGFEEAARRALSLGRSGTTKDETADEMRLNRRANRKTGAVGGVSLATMRPKDPMWYWTQNNLPYEIDKEDELRRLRKYTRLLYLTHPVIASAIEIFSKFPLSGLEFTCKDPSIASFYEDLFFDQLDYEEFLVDMLRSYWIMGEAWPFGSFNETLGVWEVDELLNPDDIRVVMSPFSKEPRFEMRLPPVIRNLINNREPLWEYDKLIRNYPELLAYQHEDAWMPVSNILLRQIRFKGDLFHPRGVPILMRGLRAVMQEEQLNSAQDAMADRLATPLIVCKLGAPGPDLGPDMTYWVPTAEEIEEFETAFDAALVADFRVLTTNFTTQIESAFGREVMPDFSSDFDRLDERILQVFGMSKTMLSGGDTGETYAADAMNRDLVSQLLGSAQRLVKRFMRERMLVVAEAQEHYDYEVRNGKRYVITEEVLEVDEETGEQRIVEQPKLLIPEVKIKSMDMRHEEETRTFIEAAVAAGVPVSDKTRFVNIDIDLEEERDAVTQERVDKAIAEQETRRETYLALKARRLPIPSDLLADFEPTSQSSPGQEQTQAAAPAAPPGPALPSLNPNEAHPALVPTEQDVRADQVQEGQQTGQSNVVQLQPRNRAMQPGKTRPPESDEMRANMPTASLEQPIYHQGQVITGFEDGAPVTDPEAAPFHGKLVHGPRHIGMRRHARIDPDEPLEAPGDRVEPTEEAG